MLAVNPALQGKWDARANRVIPSGSLPATSLYALPHWVFSQFTDLANRERERLRAETR
jgi:hypothetical protein